MPQLQHPLPVTELISVLLSLERVARLIPLLRNTGTASAVLRNRGKGLDLAGHRYSNLRNRRLEYLWSGYARLYTYSWASQRDP